MVQNLNCRWKYTGKKERQETLNEGLEGYSFRTIVSRKSKASCYFLLDACKQATKCTHIYSSASYSYRLLSLLHSAAPKYFNTFVIILGLVKYRIKLPAEVSHSLSIKKYSSIRKRKRNDLLTLEDEIQKPLPGASLSPGAHALLKS